MSDQQAMRQFVGTVHKQYHEELTRFLRNRLPRQWSDVEDIVQEIFLRIANLYNSHNHISIRAFLYTIARNVIIDLKRRQQTQQKYEDDLTDIPWVSFANQQTPEQLAHYHELQEALRKTIRRLPPKRRRIFILSRIHGLSYAEIATETGLSLGGVKKHMNRALAACQSSMADIAGRSQQTF